MKKALPIACTLLFFAMAGFAQAPGTPLLTSAALSAILGPSTSGGACAKPAVKGEALFASSGIESFCSATANCSDGLTVSCQGNSNCTSVDSNCGADQPGYVVCDGVTTSCHACCNDGTLLDRACCRCAANSNCMDCCRCAGGTRDQCFQQCNPF